MMQTVFNVLAPTISISFTIRYCSMQFKFHSFFRCCCCCYARSLSLSRSFKQKYSLTLDLISIMAASTAITVACSSILSNVRVNIGHCQAMDKHFLVLMLLLCEKKKWTHRLCVESGQLRTADNGFLCVRCMNF